VTINRFNRHATGELNHATTEAFKELHPKRRRQMPKGPRTKLKPTKREPHVPQIEARYAPTVAAAKYFNVSPVTIWRALRDGRLNYVTIGKRRLVDLSSAQP
jgi:hypothetical protein